MVARRVVEESLHQAREARAAAAAERAFTGDAVRRALDEAGSSVPSLRSLLAIADERRALYEHDRATREQASAAIELALRRLRACATSRELSHDAPADLRDACGFTRVMISRALGTRWFPDTMRVGDGADPESADFERFASDGNEIPLGRMLPETQMMRDRVPVMVADAGNEPRAYKPLIRVTQSTGYVAAPIVTAGRVIGFLHADRAGQRSSIAAGDLESMALFAAEFGVLFERAVLAERTERRRALAGAALRDAAAELDALSAADPELGWHPHPSLRGGGGRAAQEPAPRRDALLTARERDILERVASGATNEAIARELVVSADTVKTHVSSILRKLRASTRAEAVARYMVLREHDGGARR